MNFTQLKFKSIDVTFLHPLDENSKLIFPVPANKSNILICSKLIWFFKILNNPSFAKSVVGLTGSVLGAKIFFPLYFPAIIRMKLDESVNDNNV
jgi:hypothetical protein